MIRYVDTFKYERIDCVPILKKGKGSHRDKIKYLDMVTAFDIETTNIDKYEQAVMYIWQFQIFNFTVIGRTWKEFQTFIQRVEDHVPEGVMVVCYVHNLSFEWQWLKSVLPIDDVFAMDDRKVLRVRSGKIEFRCSYLHSNMSLDMFLKKMEVRSRKVKGFNYDKKRYPWTRLTKDELHYCINDVKGLVEAIQNEMKRDGDNLYTIPLTSTGYARRSAKEALRKYQRFIKKMLPDREIFEALRKAFRGGNTHANRWNANRILTASPGNPIRSYDISSSYPAVMMTERYPRDFSEADPNKLQVYISHGKACLMQIHIENLRLKDPDFGCPYVSKAKCENIWHADYDNGRILQAEAFDTYITEIDFAIMVKEYDFDYRVDRLWIARKYRLPLSFRALIFDTYAEKTALKGGDDYLYHKAKSKFNSYYGMTVQNPCKEKLIFSGGILQPDTSESIDDLIEHYMKAGWLPYQWGVYICCYARLKLEKGLHCIPYDAFIYADTDSIKYQGDYDHCFETLNRQFIHDDLCAVDAKGKKHYLGIYEKDDEYLRFKTMGAKKYAYEDMKGKLHVTVSGVNKIKGAEELGRLENFKEGFVFRKAGGTQSKYNDFPEPKRIRIQGHELDIISNVMIQPSTYTLSMTGEYSRLLSFLATTDIRSSLHYER